MTRGLQMTVEVPTEERFEESCMKQRLENHQNCGVPVYYAMHFYYALKK